MIKPITIILLLIGILVFFQISHLKASPFAKVEQEFGLSKITIEYSRLATRGPNVFREVVPYGRIQRVGANEFTKFSYTDDLEILGNTQPKGTYALYAFPEETEWGIVFHKNISHWGDGRVAYIPEEDAFRVKVKPEPSEVFQENFLISFDLITHSSLNMFQEWANTKICIPIQVDTEIRMRKEIELRLKENPTAQTYYETARYLQEQGEDFELALAYLEKAIQLGVDT